MSEVMKNKFYITTSIAYTNAPPHIGYCLELLQADVIARYNRQLGKDVFFLTGTDEHGSKIANKAKELGKTEQVFCDEISEKFKMLKPLLNLSNDDFIRTTDQLRHWPTVNKIWQKLKENNDIYKKKYQGLYCVGCEAFVTERDLVNGKCPLHQKEPEIVEEENYFFKLSKYSSQLKGILEQNKIKVFPEAKKNEMLSFIKEGLEDVSCSREKRKLSWGAPAPDDENQTIYVWFEALINYLSALGYLTKEDKKFKTYWPPDIQCIGKDIVRFHALLWPAMLLSLGLPLPEKILIHGYITVGGEKMSKTLGNVIDPFELVEKYGADAVRYFLLREISPTEDGDFTYKKFAERFNADLANGLGNLVARVVTLASKISNGDVVILSTFASLSINSAKNPAHAKRPFGYRLRVTPLVSFSNLNFQTKTEEIKKQYKQSLEEFRFNEALGAIWELIGFCDKYVNDQKPWENKDNSKEVVGDLLFALREIAGLLTPFMPQTAEKIQEQLKTGISVPLFPRL